MVVAAESRQVTEPVVVATVYVVDFQAGGGRAPLTVAFNEGAAVPVPFEDVRPDLDSQLEGSRLRRSLPLPPGHGVTESR